MMTPKLIPIFFLCIFLIGISEGYTRPRKTFVEPIEEPSSSEESKVVSKHTGVNLTAWGIVFIILSVILIGITIYYVAIFYPFICKKQRKYDSVELSQVKSNNNKGVTNV